MTDATQTIRGDELAAGDVIVDPSHPGTSWPVIDTDEPLNGEVEALLAMPSGNQTSVWFPIDGPVQIVARA